MKRSIKAGLLLAIGAISLSAATFAQERPMHAMMDTDGDGAISAAEHAAGAAAMFAKADADADGSISADEMHAMHGRMMGAAAHGKAGDCACCKHDGEKPKDMPADHAGHAGHDGHHPARYRAGAVPRPGRGGR